MFDQQEEKVQDLIEMKRRCPKCGGTKYESGGTEEMPGHDLHQSGQYLGKFIALRRCKCTVCGTRYRVKIVDPHDMTAERKALKLAIAAEAEAEAAEAERQAKDALERAKEYKKKARALKKAAK